MKWKKENNLPKLTGPNGNDQPADHNSSNSNAGGGGGGGGSGGGGGGGASSSTSGTPTNQTEDQQLTAVEPQHALMSHPVTNSMTSHGPPPSIPAPVLGGGLTSSLHHSSALLPPSHQTLPPHLLGIPDMHRIPIDLQPSQGHQEFHKLTL